MEGQPWLKIRFLVLHECLDPGCDFGVDGEEIIEQGGLETYDDLYVGSGRNATSLRIRFPDAERAHLLVEMTPL